MSAEHRENSPSPVVPPSIEAQSPEEYLARLRRRVRQADFRPDVLGEVDLLTPQLHRLQSANTHDFFKALATCAQVLDYFGKYAEAQALVAEHGSLAYMEFLTCAGRETEDERLLMKEKVWLVIHYSKSFYRANDLPQAERIVEKCADVLKRFVETQDDPCHRTWGYLEYTRGQIRRQRLDYDRSTDAMQACLWHARAKLEWFEDQPQQGNAAEWAERRQEERTWANRRSALALALGIGWIQMTRGLLKEALPLLQIARTLMIGTHDWVNRAYIELLYGCTLRSLAGDDRQMLGEAINALSVAYKAFGPESAHGNSPGHLPYRGRAAYALALAHLYAGEIAKASEYQTEMADIAAQKNDDRWLSHASIVQSRLLRERKDFLGALRAADEAKTCATRGGQLLCEIESLIAGGEAYLELGNFAAARHRFKDALAAVRGNDQTRAVCHLHLAVASLGAENYRQADKHYRTWLKLRARIQNQIVLKMGEALSQRIQARRQDFIVSWDTDDFDYPRRSKELWEFLHERAAAVSGKQEELAERLGVSRTTLIKRTHPQRARNTS